MVKVQPGSLNKSSATLVDPSGSITAVFWQEWADWIDIDKTYIFKNLRVKKKMFLAKSMPIQPKKASIFKKPMPSQKNLPKQNPQ